MQELNNWYPTHPLLCVPHCTKHKDTALNPAQQTTGHRAEAPTAQRQSIWYAERHKAENKSPQMYTQSPQRLHTLHSQHNNTTKRRGCGNPLLGVSSIYRHQTSKRRNATLSYSHTHSTNATHISPYDAHPHTTTAYAPIPHPFINCCRRPAAYLSICCCQHQHPQQLLLPAAPPRC